MRRHVSRSHSNQVAWHAVASGEYMSKIVILTGSGTYTPTAGIKSFLVTAIGAGGGSGGVAFSATKGRCSGGGGSGSWAQKLYTTIAASYSFACGTGGTAGTNAPGAGGNGGATTFDTLSAPGGIGSGASSLDNFAGSGASPAIATGGDINVRGTCGETSVNNNWNASTVVQAGFGGSTPWGTGGNRVNAAADTVGNAGSGAGGGASGSVAVTANTAGAAGADGACIVQEFS
jgi:hypothetical protein